MNLLLALNAMKAVVRPEPDPEKTTTQNYIDFCAEVLALPDPDPDTDPFGAQHTADAKACATALKSNLGA